MNEPMTLITNRPDADVAKELKAELMSKLEAVALVMDKAHAAGFELTFSMGKRWDGKFTIAQLVVAKHF